MVRLVEMDFKSKYIKITNGLYFGNCQKPKTSPQVSNYNNIERNNAFLKLM